MFWPLCVCRHSQRTCRRAASFANLRMKMFLSSRALESPAEHLGTVGICQKRCKKNNPQKKLLNNRKRNRQKSYPKNPKKNLKNKPNQYKHCQKYRQKHCPTTFNISFFFETGAMPTPTKSQNPTFCG